MPKALVVYYCGACGHESPRWLGRCPGCDAWNTFDEVPRAPKARAARRGRALSPTMTSPGAAPIRLADVDGRPARRITTGLADLDEVLGGGIVAGSVLLLAGTPGIGKSTLALRMLDALSRDLPVLFCSAEESAAQIKTHAARLEASSEIMLVASTDAAEIIAAAQASRPQLLVVDSAQTIALADVEGSPGSPSQVRECALAITRFAKETGCAVVLVGHVTKDGAIAGPKVLEHIVDVVLYFEGDRLGPHRVLRATKNRFGATDAVCVFAMDEGGLSEVRDPSQLFLGERAAVAGSAVTATLHGARPMLVEVQALVSSAGYGTPRRLVSGLDYNRACMIVAVLERRCGMRLADQDVYVSVAGGLRVVDPAADLGMALAIASAFRNRPIRDDLACFGEIGLAGEVRAVTGAARRATEAAKLGFRRSVAPAASSSALSTSGCSFVAVRTVTEAIAAAFD
ncbi:MAG TPA: DNA repair protein RadA [Candidatus Eremiobacteraceae bacterium]|nr:DNA repair protein RadA [Candidatus Eremiobacteraceae bacterium]